MSTSLAFMPGPDDDSVLRELFRNSANGFAGNEYFLEVQRATDSFADAEDLHAKVSWEVHKVLRREPLKTTLMQLFRTVLAARRIDAHRRSTRDPLGRLRAHPTARDSTEVDHLHDVPAPQADDVIAREVEREFQRLAEANLTRKERYVLECDRIGLKSAETGYLCKKKFGTEPSSSALSTMLCTAKRKLTVAICADVATNTGSVFGGPPRKTC